MRTRMTFQRIAPVLAVITATQVAWAAEAGGGLEEIVVTAQKREESLQKAAASVSVVGGDALREQDVVNARTLDTLVSSLDMGVDREIVQIHIRGVGSVDNSPRFNPGAILNVDGIYHPPLTTSGAFLDIDRIEVIKGPQGILYGRSAIGGAVNVVTNRPTDEFEASAALKVGNYGTVQGTAVVNVPLTEQLQARVAVDGNRNDGYSNGGYNDVETVASRVHVQYLPTDNLSILLTGSYYYSGGNGPATLYYPYLDPDDPFFLPPPPDYPGVEYGNEAKTFAGYGEINWRVGPVNITWLPRYTDNTGDSMTPVGLLVLRRDHDLRVTSQELRFSNASAGRVNWLTGAYYYRSSENVPRNETILPLGPLLAASTSAFEAKEISHALFGQLTFSITDSLRLTAGARYSVDKKEGTAANQLLDAATRTPLGPVAPTLFEKTWHRTDWKVGVEVDLSESALVYANVQTGYKPGGYTLAAFTPGTTDLIPSRAVDPERLTAYSIGFKSQFLDGRLQINDEAFYYDYRGFQQEARDLITRTSSYFNAESVMVYGNDLDIAAALTPRDRFNISVSWLKSEVLDFCIPPRCFNGNPLPVSPTFSLSGGYEHKWGFSSGAAIVAAARTMYNSKKWYTFDLQPLTDIRSHHISSLNLTYYAASGRWNLGAFVNNIEDVDVPYGALQNPVAGAPGPSLRYLRPPRTYGVRLAMDF